jgi:glycosidase
LFVTRTPTAGGRQTGTVVRRDQHDFARIQAEQDGGFLVGIRARFVRPADVRAASPTWPGVRPWLPYGDNPTRNVAAQRDDPGSVLRLCRDLIAQRSAEFRGRITGYCQLPASPGVWAFQAGRP